MNSGAKQADQIAYLGKLGFSPADITGIIRHPGWTPARIIKEIKTLLDTGFCSESEVISDFKDQFPELFSAEQPDSSSLLSLFRPLTEFEKKDAEWLVDGFIPKGQITTLASDGGIGKTSAWIAIAAAVSSGKPCFLDVEEVRRTPGKVLFLSTEDSVRIVLKQRLENAGANEQNIIAPDFAEDTGGILRSLKFGTAELETVISSIRPALCIFDPLQGFVPQGCNMGDRAAMRDCMAPLISLGEKYGTTFLVICHTNKRKAAYGRDRIADSADLWDISRSVLMMGWTEDEGIRYLSQEKSNYGQLCDSILFSIDKQGIVHEEGKTWKRDREYQGAADEKKPGKKVDCKEWIINTLEEAGGKMRIKELETEAERYEFSETTWKRAKKELAKENKTRTFQDWEDGSNTWFIQLTYFV